MMPKPGEASKLTKMLQFDQFFIWKYLNGTANIPRIHFSKRETYTVTAIVRRKRLFKKKGQDGESVVHKRRTYNVRINLKTRTIVLRIQPGI